MLKDDIEYDIDQYLKDDYETSTYDNKQRLLKLFDKYMQIEQRRVEWGRKDYDSIKSLATTFYKDTPAVQFAEDCEKISHREMINIAMLEGTIIYLNSIDALRFVPMMKYKKE